MLDRACVAGVPGILVPATGPEAWDALLVLPLLAAGVVVRLPHGR